MPFCSNPQLTHTDTYGKVIYHRFYGANKWIGILKTVVATFEHRTEDFINLWRVFYFGKVVNAWRASFIVTGIFLTGFVCSCFTTRSKIRMLFPEHETRRFVNLSQSTNTTINQSFITHKFRFDLNTLLINILAQ